MRYGFDIYTPTTIPGDDPWKPLMKNKLARQTWPSFEEAVAYEARVLRANGQIKLRYVEIRTPD